MTRLIDFFPPQAAQEQLLLDHLARQSDLEELDSLTPRNYTTLLEFFLLRGTLLAEEYCQHPAITLLFQSFVGRLRGVTGGSQYIKLLKKLPHNVLMHLVQLSPPTVLSALFHVLDNHPTHSNALTVLNRYPFTLVSLLLERLRSGATLDLTKIVCHHAARRALATKLPTRDFLNHFDRDASEFPPVVTSKSMILYGRGTPNKKVFFMAVAEPLVLSAATKFDSLDLLLHNAPEELKELLPETFSSLAMSLNPIPPCFVPYVAAIAARFSPAIFGRLRDPVALLRALKIFLDENPDQADWVAKFVIRNRQLWGHFSRYMADFPALAGALPSYLVTICDQYSDSCADLLRTLQFTDASAVNCVNLVAPHMPESFSVICECAKCGEIAFRVAALVVAADLEIWAQFCRFFRGNTDFTGRFLAVASDFVKSNDVPRGIELLFHISVDFAAGIAEIHEAIGQLLMTSLGRVYIVRRDNLVLLVKTLAQVHRFSRVLVPILAPAIDVLEPRLLDLVRRFLCMSWDDPRREFLVFRLRYIIHRRDIGQSPNSWPEEPRVIEVPVGTNQPSN
jgi:hypothetical protein